MLCRLLLEKLKKSYWPSVHKSKRCFLKELLGESCQSSIKRRSVDKTIPISLNVAEFSHSIQFELNYFTHLFRSFSLNQEKDTLFHFLATNFR